MRLEPLARKTDWVALTSVLCGLAPPVLMVLAVIPLVGCLASPFSLAAVPCAIGFGIAGVVRAKSQPEPNYVLPLTGLVLGVGWVLLGVAGLVYFARAGGMDSLLRRFH